MIGLSTQPTPENIPHLKRYRYYSSLEFERHIIKDMIPDVYQYIANIFYCLDCAMQSRLIIEDIILDITTEKQQSHRFINSKSYPVGTVSVDAREYLRRNFREWCEYVSKINDSLAHIINIALGFNMPLDDVRPQKIIQELRPANQYKELIDICREIQAIIKTPCGINNASKHHLNLRLHERLKSDKLNSTEYYLNWESTPLLLGDIMCPDYEQILCGKILDLLDVLFQLSFANKNPLRLYIQMDNYNEHDNGILLANSASTPRTETLLQSVPAQTSVECECVQWTRHEMPPDEVYFATYYYDIRRKFESIGVMQKTRVDVYREETLIGTYRCKEIHYAPWQLEFIKYEWTPCSSY